MNKALARELIIHKLHVCGIIQLRRTDIYMKKFLDDENMRCGMMKYNFIFLSAHMKYDAYVLSGPCILT